MEYVYVSSILEVISLRESDLVFQGGFIGAEFFSCSLFCINLHLETSGFRF